MATKTEAVRYRATPKEIERLDAVIEERNRQALERDPLARPTNRNKVLQALTRNFVGLGPAFLSDELLTLQESNRRLLAIGRNLNQVVKKIHSGEIQPDALSVKYLEGVALYVRNMKDSLDKLVEQNAKRGQLPMEDDNA